MKSLKTILIGLAVTVLSAGQLKAQFMPVVYDNTYGRGNQLIASCADFQGGDVVTAVISNGRVVISWLDRDGEPRFTKEFGNDDLANVSNVIAVSENQILVVGNRSAIDNTRIKSRQTGRALIVNNSGIIERNLHIGDNGTVVTNGAVMPNGSLILSGSTPNASGGMSGFVSKISDKGKVIYNYMAATGETCDLFDVFGSKTEYVNAAFTSDGRGSSVVRIDENGNPFFITTLPDPTFRIEKMQSVIEGDIYLVGQGEQAGGNVVKLRTEGDIVFHKQVVPASASARVDKLIVCNTGELLVGGGDYRNAYYLLLRSDGTELSSNVDVGVVGGFAHNAVSGDSFVSLYNPLGKQGKVVKLSKTGRRMYEKNIAANYTDFHINGNGDILMAAPEVGRLTMFSNFGALLFDRYVVENNPQYFTRAYLPRNGSVVFTDDNSRVAKLAHGIYVSDIQTSKPINGYSTATFTVTLSGYSFSKEGTPLPVTVNYRTSPVTAKEGLNYEPVAGTVSFVPSSDPTERYMNKFTIEVPIMANDLLEGNRMFSLDLSDVKQSYIIKGKSKATIEDQPAIVKLISMTPGVEGERNVVFTLGIFKTNGIPLTNATRSEIVVDGAYGTGTADRLDYDMSRMPRLIIPEDQHGGQFEVMPLEDTRYELAKSVVVNFNKVFAMSDTNVSFAGNSLSCSGLIYDQPAVVIIESLGDHTKLNSVISSLFKVSLVRAKDGAPLVNNSGADIIVTPVVNDSSAVQGKDFVLTNSHDLRIWGDDRSSAVNLNGVVLYSVDKDPKTVSVSISEVEASPDAGPISISTGKNTATFNITNN